MSLPRRGHKYGAKATMVDGIRFASQAEARRYQELKLLEKAGEVKELELQPKFPLYASILGQQLRPQNQKPVCTYVADFRYRYGPKGILTVEDVKGMKTAMYRLKKRWVLAQYGIQILETR